MAHAAQIAIAQKRRVAAGLSLVKHGNFTLAGEELEKANESGESFVTSILAAEAYLRGAYEQLATIMRRESRDGARVHDSRSDERLETCRQTALSAARLVEIMRFQEKTSAGLHEDERKRLEQVENGIKDLLLFLPKSLRSGSVDAEAMKALVCCPDAAVPGRTERRSTLVLEVSSSSSSSVGSASDSCMDDGFASKNVAEEAIATNPDEDHVVQAISDHGSRASAATKAKAKAKPKAGPHQHKIKANQSVSKAQLEADEIRKEEFYQKLASLRARRKAAQEAEAKAEEERQAAFEAQRNSERERVCALFASWDVDGNGTISPGELRKTLAEYGWLDDQISELFARMDIDKDGRVAYNEFVCWLFSEPASPMKRNQQTLNKLNIEKHAVSCFFLLEEQQPGFQRTETHRLIENAVFHAVPGEHAVHPQRAEGAVLLMGCSHAWLETSGPGNGLDIEINKLLFFDSIPSENVTIDSIELVVQHNLLKRFLEKASEIRSRIEVTFHGTRESCVAPIIADGLSTRARQKHGGLFGIGAYCGSHAGLAHKYTGPNGSGQRRMFCVLANLGKVGLGASGKRHDRTTADRIWNPTQYCVCDEERLLVTHLITYRVTGRGAFEGHLRNAVKHAAECTFKTGL